MTTTAPAPCLYVGRVMHQRLRPFRQRFSYRMWTLFVPLDSWESLGRGLRLLSVERANVVSLRARDHGPRDGRPLEPWVRARLRAAGVDDGGGRIFMLAMPRLLGYVFNPLTVYYAYDRAGRLVALLYEVKNTFGGQHVYAFQVDPDAKRLAHGCDKEFYVSPFIGMDARYAFNLDHPDERLSIVINERVSEGPQLVASFTARRRPLGDRQLARLLLAMGPLTFTVIAGIHVEALKLWWRGARFHAPSAQPKAVVAGNTAEPGDER